MFLIIYIFLDVRSSGNVINLIVCIMCLVLKLTKMYLSDWKKKMRKHKKKKIKQLCFIAKVIVYFHSSATQTETLRARDITMHLCDI